MNISTQLTNIFIIKQINQRQTQIRCIKTTLGSIHWNCSFEGSKLQSTRNLMSDYLDD